MLFLDPSSCSDIDTNTATASSGHYVIHPGGTPVTVWCDMTISGGGWTLVWVYEFTNYLDMEAPDNRGNIF